jgi:potassium-transporting ATPase potassium-binding subunit
MATPTQTAVYVVVFFALLFVGAWYLSWWMTRVFDGRVGVAGRVFGPLERGVYRLLRVDPSVEQDWKGYAKSVVWFSAASFLFVYLFSRFQGHLPLNPVSAPALNPATSFNTAWSFTTNTNWQNYSGESQASYLTQMAALAVQNFASPAVGIIVAVAMVRGFVRSSATTIGNFWVDLTRCLLYILLPIAVIGGIILVSRGVPQTFNGPVTVHTVQGGKQVIAAGPVASQIVIKQLGTNGGGYYNGNSAMPYESPTPLTNSIENYLELVIAFALPFVFGRMLRKPRQGIALFAAMAVLYFGGIAVILPAETRSTPALRAAGISATQNMEGKEQRVGVPQSAIFGVSSTMTSTGAVDSSHDSYTAVGGGVLLSDMMLGEISPGGVGSGLYTMLLFAIVTVFIAGLMVGRTPEYVGKQIRSREVKLSVIGILVMPIGVLITVAIASVTHVGTSSILNPGPHGFTEMLYALTSQWNNNGSAFAGLNGATHFWNTVGGLAMIGGRFLIIIPCLALGGALAAQKTRPVGEGTMPTDSPIFIGLLIGTIILVGALNFFPAVALGPIAEALTGRLF